jgi:hypothetical protein
VQDQESPDCHEYLQTVQHGVPEFMLSTLRLA